MLSVLGLLLVCRKFLFTFRNPTLTNSKSHLLPQFPLIKNSGLLLVMLYKCSFMPNLWEKLSPSNRRSSLWRTFGGAWEHSWLLIFPTSSIIFAMKLQKCKIASSRKDPRLLQGGSSSSHPRRKASSQPSSVFQLLQFGSSYIIF